MRAKATRERGEEEEDVSRVKKKKERREKREKKKKKRETGMRRDEENTGIETNTRLSFYQWINIEVSLEQ